MPKKHLWGKAKGSSSMGAPLVGLPKHTSSRKAPYGTAGGVKKKGKRGRY